MKQIWEALKRFWEAWKVIAKKIGNFQARVILTIFYVIAVLPFGIATRFFSDPLRIKRLPTTWLDHSDEACDLQWAKRQ